MTVELCHIAKRYKCDYMVVSGDFFHLAGTTHEERSIVADLFKSTPCPIISITGNHDKWDTALEATSLNWLTGLAPKFGNRVWDLPAVEEIGGVWWVAIPGGGWNSVEFFAITHALLEEVPKKYSGPVIALAHEYFEGAMMDTGYMGKGSKIPKLPVVRRINYWALGDIHVMQKIATNAWYCGAPYQTRFGETLPKGVLLYDTAKPKPKFVEITSLKPLVELHEVPEEWPDAYIKLKVRPEVIPFPLPQDVVRVSSISVPQSAEEIKDMRTKVSTKVYLEGLPEFLAEKCGFDEKMTKRGMKFATQLLKTLQPE
jgi:DNA repair exonuclease SbcCD nuclease subunit